MTDLALIADLSRELSDSFDRVVRQREAQVLRVAYRILCNWADAEDVAQEVFLRLHRHGLDFASDAAFGAWIYRVTVNLCFDRTRAVRSMVELQELPDGDVSAEAAIIREEQKHQLMAALATLPPKERAAIVLREIEGLPTVEVAAILGSAEATVRSQVAKALTRLRGILKKKEER